MFFELVGYGFVFLVLAGIVSVFAMLLSSCLKAVMRNDD